MTTRAKARVSAGETVAALLRRCPAAIVVFTRRRMACPGCAMAPFDTLGDAAAAYGLEAAGFRKEIARCFGNATGVPEPAARPRASDPGLEFPGQGGRRRR